PLYHSVYIERGTGKWIPPGHLKHGHWKATGDFAPGHGHGAVGVHGKAKGHGKSHGKGHGKVKVDVGGGASKGHGSKHHNKPAPQSPKKSSSNGGSPHKGGSGGPHKGGSGSPNKGGSGGGSKGGKGKK